MNNQPVSFVEFDDRPAASVQAVEFVTARSQTLVTPMLDFAQLPTLTHSSALRVCFERLTYQRGFNGRIEIRR